MNDEQWRPVVGFEGLYSISDAGRLRSEQPTLAHRAGYIHKGFRRKIGYLTYALAKNGKERALLAHRLIAEAFIGLCPRGYQCNHKDGNKANNAIDNLEWVTPLQNVRHAFEVLGYNPRTAPVPYGDAHYNTKLTAQQLADIKARGGNGRHGGPTQGELAKEYGVTRMTVYRVLHGKARSARQARGQQHGMDVTGTER